MSNMRWFCYLFLLLSVLPDSSASQGWQLGKKLPEWLTIRVETKEAWGIRPEIVVMHVTFCNASKNKRYFINLGLRDAAFMITHAGALKRSISCKVGEYLLHKNSGMSIGPKSEVGFDRHKQA